MKNNEPTHFKKYSSTEYLRNSPNVDMPLCSEVSVYSSDAKDAVISGWMTEEDWEYLVELAEKTIDFWADNALEHERCGEMIERIGLNNFLDGIEEEVDVNMVGHPRESSYVRLDDFDTEAKKWYERQDSA